ncbi:MAG: hypothetical protein JW384_00408 [Nitrosomonadaceae bacterium]|nr:hypothetical protein [Nitrosomonadaceae bacterium]
MAMLDALNNCPRADVRMTCLDSTAAHPARAKKRGFDARKKIAMPNALAITPLGK